MERGEKTIDIDGHAPIVDVAFAIDNTILVAAQRDGVVRLYRRRDAMQIAVFTAHDLGLTAIAISPGGKHLATIGLDNVVRVWRVEDLAPVSAFLPEPEIKPLAVAVAPDAQSLAVAYLNGDIRQIDLKTGRTIRRITTLAGPIWAAAFTRDGRFILAADNNERVGMWHLQSGDVIGRAPERDERPTPWLTSEHPGAGLYRKCANCHALNKNEHQRSGPHLRAIFGRRAGGLAGYRYSPALKASKTVWSRTTIADLFRRGPDVVFPGTKMPVQLIADEAALNDLLDYLELIAPPVDKSR